MGVISFSATLSVNDGSASAQQNFGQVVTVTGPAPEAEPADASYLNMSSRYRAMIPGLINPGSLSFELNYTKADYVRLQALLNTDKTWNLHPPTDDAGSSAVMAFNGILKKHEITAGNAADVLKVKCDVQITTIITTT